ncbi:hypothetical protein TIFTF001_047653 [Ficus carica]|uniref:Uncharacterized protein n=1 Tax=Ficus carica TaxID=3494 RepID=A0AA88CKC2_FICCA|nr:hypothetical protein TIFTF001_047634 [Ficus carica]GMN24437.1 hypothetical protein TIFTF001_047638 [Ficus carica]GMN24593.1 hypothetical protein TIFTF001_047649 [Ficus carica]GMN24618.1 hypothetical protein TIFTF001_047653 [Ficus carica]
MSLGICLSVFLLVFLLAGSKANINDGQDCLVARIGGVIEYSSRVGKEQKIAIEMAAQDLIFINNSPTCTTLDLHLQDSRGNPARATASGNNST